jgi:hypothetical protein
LRRAALPPMGQELPPLPHNLNAAQHLKILLIPFQEPLECKGSSPLVLAQSPCRKLETLSKSEGAAATLDAPIPVPVAPREPSKPRSSFRSLRPRGAGAGWAGQPACARCRQGGGRHPHSAVLRGRGGPADGPCGGHDRHVAHRGHGPYRRWPAQRPTFPAVLWTAAQRFDSSLAAHGAQSGQWGDLSG